MEKSKLYEFLSAAAADPRNLEMVQFLLNGNYIRVVNYHATDPFNAERFEAEIRYYSEHFANVTMADIDRFFETKKWPHEKPGLIPTFFEGFRNQYDIILPILNKYHVTGWFYIPSFYMDVPVAEQLEFSRTHELDLTDEAQYPDGRVAMTWDEVREIAKDHEICCHTGNHFQLTAETSEEDMRTEIVESKKKLEKEIGREVKVFCWLYGEEYNYNAFTHKYLEEAGYTYVLGNLKLEKIR